eukprot:5390941-Amphidinium_carterae.1
MISGVASAQRGPTVLKSTAPETPGRNLFAVAAASSPRLRVARISHKCLESAGREENSILPPPLPNKTISRVQLFTPNHFRLANVHAACKTVQVSECPRAFNV